MTPLKDVWKKFFEEEASLNFHPVDFYFAKTFLPEDPFPPFLFLAYLMKISREGHLCAFVEEKGIVPSLSKEIDPILMEGAKALHGVDGIIIQEESRYYLKRNWDSEKKILRELSRLEKQKPSPDISENWLEKRLEKEVLNSEQKKALLESANRPISLILGGPGTGKTYAAKVLVKIFSEKIGEKIAVSAPTGKATANLRAALKDLGEKISIQTLHSLLKADLLSADLILVDEASMIDARLMSRLFERVKDGARVILLGDPYQLPPIESGHFFQDLSEKRKWTSRLTHCLRSDLREIVEMGERVKEGKMIPFQPLLDLESLISYLTQEEKTILTPFKKGIFGSDHLNHKFLELHRKKGKTKIPIMITVNDSYLELFNGDMGVLDEAKGVAIFGKKEVPLHLLPRYETAFVISVHKAQGSEYEKLCVLLPEGSEIFGKEMLYTAITRAKKSVEILTHEKTLVLLLKNSTRRLSGL